LSTRVVELAQQSEVTGEPVGLIVADLDRFKRINDTLGHSTGDAVLKEVAYLLRKQLRAFDLAYRLGGEEFLILVPGSDVAGTVELAERLRAVIAAERVAGVPVTMSLGVHASARGTRFDYESVFAAADAALYRAKREGRDTVCAEQEPSSVDDVAIAA
jgi:diguanylate cyclase (GGDEF)-like protein